MILSWVPRRHSSPLLQVFPQYSSEALKYFPVSFSEISKCQLGVRISILKNKEIIQSKNNSSSYCTGISARLCGDYKDFCSPRECNRENRRLENKLPQETVIPQYYVMFKQVSSPAECEMLAVFAIAKLQRKSKGQQMNENYYVHNGVLFSYKENQTHDILEAGEKWESIILSKVRQIHKYKNLMGFLICAIQGVCIFMA